MKKLALLLLLSALTACAGMTPEQKQAYLQYMAQHPYQPYYAKPYVMPTQQQSTTQTNCYSYVPNQVQCQSTTTH